MPTEWHSHRGEVQGLIQVAATGDPANVALDPSLPIYAQIFITPAMVQAMSVLAQDIPTGMPLAAQDIPTGMPMSPAPPGIWARAAKLTRSMPEGRSYRPQPTSRTGIRVGICHLAHPGPTHPGRARVRWYPGRAGDTLRSRSILEGGEPGSVSRAALCGVHRMDERDQLSGSVRPVLQYRGARVCSRVHRSGDWLGF